MAKKTRTPSASTVGTACHTGLLWVSSMTTTSSLASV